MSAVAFAVPPPSLLPASLARAGLDPNVALNASQRSPVPAEGLSVRAAAAAPPESAGGAETDDVLEVQLSSSGSGPSMDAMTVKQLKTFAADKGVSLHGLSTKKQILQKLKASGL